SATPLRSAPAQNVPSAPVRIATLSESSASKRRKAAASRAAVGPSTALRTSGRLMVTMAIDSVVSNNTWLIVLFRVHPCSSVVSILLLPRTVILERIIPLAHGLPKSDIARARDEVESFLRVACDAVEEGAERSARREAHVLRRLIAERLQHHELVGRHTRHAL